MFPKIPNINNHQLTNEAKLRLALHQKANPHAWWTPTGAQFDFLKELERIGSGKPGHRCRLAILSGGKCTGKSATLVNIALGLVLDKVYNQYVEQSKFFTDKSWAHGFSPNGNLVIYMMMPKRVIKQIFTPEMQKWAPKGSYTTEKGDEKFDWKWEFVDGGTIYIYTTHQQIDQIEGGQADVIMTDEHFPFHFYQELQDRLRAKGCWLTFQTPKHSMDSAKFFGMVNEMPDDERILRFMAKESACKKHGIRGFRDHGDIEEETRKCPADLRPAVVDGVPMAFQGKVFKVFARKYNIITSEEAQDLIDNKGATLYMACDPAEARPWVMAWAAVFPDGDIVWLDEWPNWDPGIYEEPLQDRDRLKYYLSPHLVKYTKLDMRLDASIVADIVRAKEDQIKTKYGLNIHARFIDPRYSSRTLGKGNTNLRAQLADCGVDFYPAVAETEQLSAFARINSMLTPLMNEEGVVQRNATMRFVEENRNQIYCLSQICYTANTKQGEFTGEIVTKIDEKDPLKDFIDVTRYLVQKNPYYVDNGIRVSQEKDEVPKMVIEFDNDGRRMTPRRNYGIFKGL